MNPQNLPEILKFVKKICMYKVSRGIFQFLFLYVQVHYTPLLYLLHFKTQNVSENFGTFQPFVSINVGTLGLSNKYSVIE